MSEQQTMEKLLEVVADTLGITTSVVLSRNKEEKPRFARGIFCCVGREIGLHPIKIAGFLGRSRTSCITTAKRYREYVECGDKLIKKLVEKVKEEMNE